MDRMAYFKARVFETLYHNTGENTSNCRVLDESNSVKHFPVAPPLQNTMGVSEKPVKLYTVSQAGDDYVARNITNDLRNSSDNSDESDEVEKRPRKRKRKKVDNKVTLYGGQEQEESIKFNKKHLQNKDLTKNQKRKLKKKRHKDRIRCEDSQEQLPNKEFTVDVLTAKGIPVDSAVDYDTRVAELTTFFDAIWDIYQIECRLSGQTLKQSDINYDQLCCYITNADVECLGHLEKLKRLLSYGNKQDYDIHLVFMETSTLLQPGDLSSLKKLCDYWWKGIAGKS